jgi:hypothetical protein
MTMMIITDRTMTITAAAEAEAEVGAAVEVDAASEGQLGCSECSASAILRSRRNTRGGTRTHRALSSSAF